jgi:hypothetical protein
MKFVKQVVKKNEHYLALYLSLSPSASLVKIKYLFNERMKVK